MALTRTDFETAAKVIGVSPAALQAVAEVESNGGAFIDGRRPKVQYEPHVMYQRVSAKFGKAKADVFAKQYPDLISTKMGSYQSLEKEDADMDRAAKLIDRDCALESSSWGAFQIMGYHWKACGYDSIQDFVNKQYSEYGQLETLVRFLKANPAMVKAMIAKDWAEFARRYNGPGYAKNRYDVKLANAYKKFGGT